jgi:hypothetical protein
MPIKYTFGGLGKLAECVCGSSEFIRHENVQPTHMVVYESVNCHEWFIAKVPPSTVCQKRFVLNINWQAANANRWADATERVEP